MLWQFAMKAVACSQCANPHYNVYGTQKLFAEKHCIVPDYTSSIGEVYFEAIRYVYCILRTLRLANFVAGHGDLAVGMRFLSAGYEDASS